MPRRVLGEVPGAHAIHRAETLFDEKIGGNFHARWEYLVRQAPQFCAALDWFAICAATIEAMCRTQERRFRRGLAAADNQRAGTAPRVNPIIDTTADKEHRHASFEMDGSGSHPESVSSMV